MAGCLEMPMLDEADYTATHVHQLQSAIGMVFFTRLLPVTKIFLKLIPKKKT
jgi:hypothetical protein